MTTRLALVTGATGHIGTHLVPALLDAGWAVRVLTRRPDQLTAPWRDRVEVVGGDLANPDDAATALAGVQVAYFLVHSMDGRGDFRDRDRELAELFARAARDAEVGRIVYLSGLHPDGDGSQGDGSQDDGSQGDESQGEESRGEELSPHMASRVEVGEILLASGVPTAVLQAAVVLGAGSASFDMLRHLTERLPVAVGPRWLDNLVQPIATKDVVHYLVRAAELPREVNRTIDVAMEERLSYRDMMRRYAKVTGLTPRLVGTVPVLTPNLASHWVGLITPVSAAIARPLVGSLVHAAVKSEDDAATLLGDPPEGLLGFDDAVREATSGLDPQRWGRSTGRIVVGLLAVSGTALVGWRFVARLATGRRRDGR